MVQQPYSPYFRHFSARKRVAEPYFLTLTTVLRVRLGSATLIPLFHALFCGREGCRTLFSTRSSCWRGKQKKNTVQLPLPPQFEFQRPVFALLNPINLFSRVQQWITHSIAGLRIKQIHYSNINYRFSVIESSFF